MLCRQGKAAGINARDETAQRIHIEGLRYLIHYCPVIMDGKS
jgi:hypothetical protein